MDRAPTRRRADGLYAFRLESAIGRFTPPAGSATCAAANVLALICQRAVFGIATYHVSLSIARPPNLSDRGLMDLFRQAVDRAMCFAIE